MTATFNIWQAVDAFAPHTYRAGDRVSTPRGAGRVAYVRMSPPDYRAVAAVSVVLDSCRHRPDYAGSIFLASDVAPAAAACELCSEPAGAGGALCPACAVSR